MKENRPLPVIQSNQVTWIFDTAREQFSKEVRDLQLDILRLRQFPDEAPQAEPSFVRRQMIAADLIEDKENTIKKYLPVIEFCDVMRERSANYSSSQFAKAFFKSKL